MTAATHARASKEKGPADGPFAALWLLFRELLKSWRSLGSGFEAAFEAIEAEFKGTLLTAAINAYNSDNPDLELSAEDFEIRAVPRGRGCVYDVFAKSGRTLGDEIAHREAEARRDAEREHFRLRRVLARYQRWTWVRKCVRGKLANAYRRIGRAGRARLGFRLRAASLAGVSSTALAASSRAPP